MKQSRRAYTSVGITASHFDKNVLKLCLTTSSYLWREHPVIMHVVLNHARSTYTTVGIAASSMPIKSIQLSLKNSSNSRHEYCTAVQQYRSRAITYQKGSTEALSVEIRASDEIR
jgi:hypothetical protein